MKKKSIERLNAHNLPLDEERKNKLMLNLNENVYGYSKSVNKAIKKGKFSLYPDDNSMKLREKIGYLYNISSKNIIIGNGSGEILQIICRTFLNNDDEVISCVPTYPYYYVETIIENGKFIEVPLKNMRFDVDGIISNITDKTKIIFITNPNNPTGTIISKEEQERLIKNVRKDILIVVDEAYYEYVNNKKYPDTIEYLKEFSNVCILRTFSKAYGIAAFRVGYLVANEEIIDRLEKVRLTFNVSKISQIAAEKAIKDQKFIIKCKINNYKVKEYLYNQFKKMNIEYCESEANFIMIKLNEKQREILTKNNIVVKNFEIENNIYTRLTVGTIKQMKLLIKLLKN